MQFHVTQAEMRHKRKIWNEEIKKIDSWAELRKKATGHYDKDTKLLIELIDKIDKNQVVNVAIALLRINQDDLKLMKSIGDMSST